MGWKKALFFVLLSTVGSAVFSQNEPDQVQIELTGMDATAFPEVNAQFRILPYTTAPAMRLSQEQMMVREGDLNAGIVRLQRLKEDQPLYIALVIDRSSYAAGNPFSEGVPVLSQVKASVNELFDLMRAANDSVMLVGYSGEVDMITDLNRDMEVFSLILNDLDARGGAAFFDAIQVAMEALSVHDGMKHVIAISHGPDTHSRQTSASQLSAYAKAQGIAVHVLTTTQSDLNIYQTLGEETGGSCQVIRSGKEMAGYLAALFRSMRDQYALTFRSPDAASVSGLHPFRMDVWQGSQVVMQLQGAYRPGELGIYPYSGDDGRGSRFLYWLGGVLALVFGAGGAYAFLMYIRDRAASAPVIPVILELSYDSKRDRLKVKYNVPSRAQPVKFTIYSESGAPVIDAVLSGRKTQALVDISAIPNGQYVCDISNAGVVSETRKMTWHNP
jgi:hypothetical protein